MGYRYDSLLTEHFEKQANVLGSVGMGAMKMMGGAARGVGNFLGGMFGRNAVGRGAEMVNPGAMRSMGQGAANMARGAFGLGAKANSGVVGRGLNRAAGVGAMAVPALMGASSSAGSGSQPGHGVTASLREKAATYSLKMAKVPWEDVVNPLSYLAMAGGNLASHMDPVKHPVLQPALHYGLEGLGLAGLGATTGKDIINQKDVGRNLIDLGALAAFMGTTAHRAHKPPPH